MQPSQLRPGLDADLLDERAPGIPVGVQRLGLAFTPVQRQHPQPVQPLAQRVLGQQRLDLADHLPMATGGEVRAQCQLRRRQPQLLQPPDLRRRERLVGQVGQRVATKQRQRLMRRAAPVATRLHHEPLEAAHVDELGIDAQLIAAPMRDDLRRAVGRQHATQPPHIGLQHLRRARRHLLTPQPLDQALRRDRAVRVQHEHRQHRALLRAAERERAIADARFEMAEHTNLHDASGQPNQFLGIRAIQLDARCSTPV